MPQPDIKDIQSFESAADLAGWLKVNHRTETELWIKIYKKDSNVKSVTWDDVVVESLCWGWIDGIKKSLDKDAYLQRITPRKAKSSWSKRNRQHVERLISQGRMTQAGMVHVKAAQVDGRWENAYAVSEMQVPDDFIKALDAQPKAKQFFESLNKSNRYVIAHGLLDAKKPETRQRRFEKFMDMMVQGIKPAG